MGSSARRLVASRSLQPAARSSRSAQSPAAPSFQDPIVQLHVAEALDLVSPLRGMGGDDRRLVSTRILGVWKRRGWRLTGWKGRASTTWYTASPVPLLPSSSERTVYVLLSRPSRLSASSTRKHRGMFDSRTLSGSPGGVKLRISVSFSAGDSPGLRSRSAPVHLLGEYLPQAGGPAPCFPISDGGRYISRRVPAVWLIGSD